MMYLYAAIISILLTITGTYYGIIIDYLVSTLFKYDTLNIIMIKSIFILILSLIFPIIIPFVIILYFYIKSKSKKETI